MLGLHRKQAGDTIIEVLCAIVVFSSLAVGTIAIMNQGLNSAQKALEITQVRQQIDAQAETLRYINQAYLAALSQSDSSSLHDGLPGEWEKLRTIAQGPHEVTPFETGSSSCSVIPPAGFIMDSYNTTIWSQKPVAMNNVAGLPAYSQLIYDADNLGLLNAYGVWVEATADAGQAKAGYIDFHIRACWQGAGNGPVTSIGTIVRLYDPQT